MTVGAVGGISTVASGGAQLNISNSTFTVGLFTSGSTYSFLPAVNNNVNLGASSFAWKAVYLAGQFVWNSYAISAPSGSTTTFLRNDGTWATPAFTGVSSFNTRTGAVTLSSGDVTGALGYTPYQTGGALGTPSSGNLTNCTFPTLNQNTTGNAATATSATSAGALSGGTLYTGTGGSANTLYSTTSVVALGNSSTYGVFVNSFTNFAPSGDNIMIFGSSGFFFFFYDSSTC